VDLRGKEDVENIYFSIDSLVRVGVIDQVPLRLNADIS